MAESKARKSAITWNQYFMGVAELASFRSKDPRTQVGACIVKNNKIISTGYNGMPTGCDDNIYPWGKEGDNPWDKKYFYVVHAELNAILNAKNSVKGATLYVTKFPCNECAKAIIQSGIKKIICIVDEDDKNSISTSYTRKMFSDGRIKVEVYKGTETMLNLVV